MSKDYKKLLSSAKINWSELLFNFYPTKSMVLAKQDGSKWLEPTLDTSFRFNISSFTQALHQGQTLFEGLKAYSTKDKRLLLFRDNKNLERINNGADRMYMPQVPKDLWEKLLEMVLKDNIEQIPPYESRGSLYIRPLLFGSSAVLGVTPSKEQQLAIMTVPVGNQQKGAVKGIKAKIEREFDRASPLGTGNVKTAANQSQEMLPLKKRTPEGFLASLQLDAKTKNFIEEFGTSNFASIINNTQITVKSDTILPSITNDSLKTICKNIFNMKVEERSIKLSELEHFEKINAEVAAVGTAVVVTPIKYLHDEKTVQTFADHVKFQELYKYVTDLQYGDIKDELEFTREINLDN